MLEVTLFAKMNEGGLARATSNGDSWVSALSTLDGRKFRKSVSINDLRLRMAEVAEEQRSSTTDPPSSPQPLNPAAQISWRSEIETPQTASDSCEGTSRTQNVSLTFRRPRSALSSPQSSNRSLLLPKPHARSLQPISQNLSKRLQSHCNRALSLLEQLQGPALRRYSFTEDPVMPKTALRFSRSLVFNTQKKAAFGLGIVWGRGFIVHNLGKSWSAPLFVKEMSFSAGLSFGGRVLESILAMPTEAGFQQFLERGLRTAIDLGLTLETDPFEGRQPTVVSSSEWKTNLATVDELPKQYSLSDGMIVDVSWRIGKFGLDVNTNRAIYGSDVSIEHILQGVVQIPKEFLPLYEALHELTETAQVVKATMSQFELTRTLVKRASNASESSSPRLGIGKIFRKRDSRISDISDSALTDSNPHESQAEKDHSFHLFGREPLLDLDLDASDGEQ